MTGRTWWQAFRDRALASDPGLVRLISAGRAVLAIATALGLELLLAEVTGRPPLIPLMLGAVLAMLSAFGVLDPTRGGQAVTMCFLPLFLLAGMALALAVDRNRPLSLATFVLVVFVAVLLRRFGPRFFTCGMVGFMGYFFALFLGLRPEQLPDLLPPVVLAIAWVLLLTLVLLPIRNDRVLRRMIWSFEARLAALAEATARLHADGDRDDPDRDDAQRRIRSRLVQLNETALMIDGQLGTPSAVSDDAMARTLRRAVFDGELAAGALVDAVARLVDDPAADATHRQAAVDLLDAVRHRDWDRLHAVADALTHDDGTPVRARRLAADALVLAAVRAEWAGTAGTDDPADGSEPEFAPAVELFAGALPGSAPTVQRVHDPDTGTGAPERRFPRLSLNTRQAIQAALATAAAVAVGDALSSQRYYWAVLAAFIAFTGTATVAETVRKAVHRTVGTLVGLLAAIPLVPLIGTNVAVVITVILASVFGAFYLFRVSYAVMIFFITLMLGELYALLGSFTVDLMILRLTETAAGGAIGCLVAVLVLPTRTLTADREARRALLTALADLLDAVDLRLRRGGHETDLAASARALDAALHQALLIGRPLGRTWMVAPNPWGVRRLTSYTALAHHARHLARTVDAAARPSEYPAALTAACARLRDLVAATAHGRAPAPGALTAVADLLAPISGSAGELAPLAREVGLLAAELDTLTGSAGEDSRVPAVTRRIQSPGREPVSATVTLVDPTGRQVARTDTDERGCFTITPEAPGTYLVVASPRPGTGSAAPHGEYVRVDRDVVLPDLVLRPAPITVTAQPATVSRSRRPSCAITSSRSHVIR
ncbi:putative membrane protein YccC [Pseudonocardia endophytica]|uniref:Putative membrane protein YccC n=2 Tax=Pseudonocardia endophytica TaxID=401976 RepID=A0A4R1HRM0_PSEEN|nr:putative membrane protein YccC [Pseudonocardia endophytica]